MRKYYPGITIFKLIGAILVLSGHIKTPGFFVAWVQHVPGLFQMFSLVVPCFYIISGFLAYKGWTHAAHSGKYIRNYLTWLLIAYGSFCLFFLFTGFIPGFSSRYFGYKFTGGNLHLLFEVFVIKGPYPSLWFIPPLILGIFLSWFFERSNRFWVAILLGIAGFLLGQAANGTLRVLFEGLSGIRLPAYFSHWGLLEMGITNYLGMGLPSVVAGVFIARHEAWFMQVTAKRLLVWSVCSVVAELLILTWAHHAYLLIVSMVPLSLLLFYGVLHIRKEGVKKHHRFINLFSIVLYFSHMIWVDLTFRLLNWPSEDKDITTLHALVAMGCALLAALGLTKLLVFQLAKRQAVVAG